MRIRHARSVAVTALSLLLVGALGPLAACKPSSTGATAADLQGTTWQWVRTVSPVGTIVAPDPAGFTVTLGDSGQAAIQADCNHGAGSYSLEGSKLKFGPIALTRMACTPGSLGDRFLRQLQITAGCFMKKDTLYVDLQMDSGTMRFVKAKR